MQKRRRQPINFDTKEEKKVQIGPEKKNQNEQDCFNLGELTQKKFGKLAKQKFA